MKLTTAALFFLLPSALSAQTVLIDNTDCNALDDPHNCCTGAGAGDCDGKVSIQKIMKRHLMIEDCQSFWQSMTCADASLDGDGDGIHDQWLVESGTCTQGEADQVPPAALPTTTCNAQKQTDLECRAEFDGSTIMPTVQGCRKAYKTWNEKALKGQRDAGRDLWRRLDGTPPDDTDPPDVDAARLLGPPEVVIARGAGRDESE